MNSSITTRSNGASTSSWTSSGEAYAEFDEAKSQNRPLSPIYQAYLFFDRFLNERRVYLAVIFPYAAAESENRIIVTSDIAYRLSRSSHLLSN